MIAFERGFYVTGGTLQPDAPSYVERKADSDLFTHLSHGEFCYVLTSRQMGKSSLMARTAARLRAEGVAVAVLDLTAIGQNLTAEQWYDALLGTIGQELALEEELEAFWLEHERLSPLQRWLRALREVVLPGIGVQAFRRSGVQEGPTSEPERPNARTPERPPSLVICLDEIDCVRSLPFSTDEFFAAIRECYNRRSEDAAFRRLTFCLLGVLTPSDLIQDTRTTPFNIGRRIELTDFTEAEAAPLAKGISDFGFRISDCQAALRRILYWTGGHPYLTQRLCQAVAEAVAGNPKSEIRDPQLVDRLCAELFLSHGARERDDNLLFVRERLLKSEVELASLLDLYRQVRTGKRVAADETNPLVDVLRLSGIVRVEESRPVTPSPLSPFPPSSRLMVRNRIYARVFDRAWVAANMPDAEQRRQRVAYRRGLVRASAVGALVVAVMVGLGLATVNARIAREGRETLRRSLYVADMNMAQKAVSEANLERAEELLDEHRPRKAGGADVRGFEWRYLWRLCQEDALYTFHENAGAVRDVAYSPDGKLLAVVNEDATIKLYDLATKEPATTLPTSPERGSRGPSVAFSPDGQMLAATSSIGTYCFATLWDVATKRKLHTFPASPSGPRTSSPLAFSPDGKLLAAAGWTGTGTFNGVGTLKLWDVTTKQEVLTFQWPRPLWCVAFSPDGRTLATVVGNRAVGLWSVAAKKRVALLPMPPSDWVQGVAFSPDGKTLATCGDDQTVRLWDLPGTGPHNAPAAPPAWRVVATLEGHSKEPGRGGYSFPTRSTTRSSATFAPNGKKLATASNATTAVTLWDLDRREKIATLRGHKQGVYALAFAPDSETLATGSADGTVKLWSASPTGEGTALGKLRSEALSVAFAPDSQTLATGSQDGTVRLWSATSGIELTSLQGHSGSVRSIAFSRDGKVLASGGNDRTVRLWEVDSHRKLATLTGHKDHVWCVAFSPDGKTLASGGADGTVKLWDLTTEQEVGTLQTETGVVMSLSFSPDGKTLALGTNENSVKLWDVGSKQEVASLLAHTSSVTATAFSPDGRILASGSGGTDRTIVLWDVAARQPRAVLKGCKDRINAVAFSPDGKTLASGSADASVRLWNVATGREVGTLPGPQEPVSCVAFSPDGNALAVVGEDRAVRLWRAPSFADTDAQQRSAKLPTPTR